MLAVVEFFVSIHIIPKNERLMRLLIVIEAAAPSAQLIIVSLNQIGISDIASKIAYAFVFQYITSIFTITIWTTIGMSIIYSDNSSW